MTEYTTSSQAIRDYISSKERTKNWVHSRVEPPELCYSPSVAPSIFNEPGFVLPPASDAWSNHSLPPKMVLRYSDGRPDEPIPLDAPPGMKPRLRRHDHHYRVRTGSHHSTVAGPEEIRVLPSNSPPNANAAAPPAGAHHRSKSLPRNAYSAMHDPDAPPVPPLPGYGPAPPPHAHVAFQQQQQPYPHGHGHGRNPPAIVYAPSHTRGPRYAPPAIYTHPPQMGPNGMIYSHSAPVHPSQYGSGGGGMKYVPTPYPSVVPSAHSGLTAERDRDRGRHHSHSHSRSKTPNGHGHGHSRSHSRGRRELSPASSVSSFESNGSGSTYYVMPTGRQKVHVIHTPDTSRSSSGQHSHSHSHHSPTSLRGPGPVAGVVDGHAHAHANPKKPFLQRIFGFVHAHAHAHSRSPSSASASEAGSHTSTSTSPRSANGGGGGGSTAGSSGRRLRRQSAGSRAGDGHGHGHGHGGGRSKSVPPPGE